MNTLLTHLEIRFQHRAAVQDCPNDESEPDDHLRAEQRQKNLDAKHANIRELIGKCSSQKRCS